MKLGIMQPYFLPYIGYWQLLNDVDAYIVYDNIQFTKKGWIHRNRYLCHGIEKMLTIPLEKASDYLDVRERRVSQQFDKKKLLQQIGAAYAKAPHFISTFELFTEIINQQVDNLFEFVYASIRLVAAHLDIRTPITVSSRIDIDPGLKGVERVLALCRAMKSDAYLNPIGGMALYNRETFDRVGVSLSFLRTWELSYPQTAADFVPNLSILDMLMSCGAEQTKEFLKAYDTL